MNRIINIKSEQLKKKIEKFQDWITSYNKILVAYSGGVDSSLVLYLCAKLKKENVVAVTAVSETYDKDELEFAKNFCKKYSINHLIINSSELNIPEFKNNPPNRCYYCKKELFTNLKNIAGEQAIEVICDGSNIDDNSDYRPGFIARDELGIKSPLQECGFTKNDIRECSKLLGLAFSDRPAMACYSSRFPYGTEITEENVTRISDCEKFLRKMYSDKNIRVRYHGNICRIETDSDIFISVIENRKKISDYFKSKGFKYITLDIDGYRQGSLNEVL